MTYDEVLAQVLELLQRDKRVAYRVLKRRFGLDDEYVADLKADLIKAKRLARDEEGEVLVWVGRIEEGEKAKGGKGEKDRDSEPRTPNSELIAGERRQLTVQFIDLVGSTTLSQQLDPEELRTVIQAYRETCATVIRRFEGYLAKYIGDGLLVYFGYPLAHEDDAQRAVRAGLGILAALPQLNARLRSTIGADSCAPLQVRLGIHTGVVVAGEMGTEDQPEPMAIVGETPNIAARLQEQAQPNSVVISPTTCRLVSGLFECEELGPQPLKGIATPLVVYRVVRESEVQSRFEVAIRTGLTPLIGRAHEMGLLRERWEKARQGEGQVVLLSGEPGIGKSRLVQELKDQLEHERVTRIEFRCSPYHQNSALYPIIDHLQRLLQFAREDSPATKLEKLQHMLSHYRFPQADTVPLVAALLSLPHPEGYLLITVSPQKQKEKTQAALVAWLVEEAEQQPVYNTWEDLHWADPSTLEVLNLVVDQAPTACLYVLLTFRPEFMPPWGNQSHLSQMTLSRLGRSQVETMVERVTGGKALPPEVVQQIVAKTDGVPLFVEELTKTVVETVRERGTGNGEQEGKIVGAHQVAPLPALGIPATLHDALMARLDRLGTAKEIAQVGATIGREFDYALLQAVSLLDEGMLQHGLKQLVEAELVYQRGLVPQAHYIFKHALIQDTAYQSLLKSTRQHYHRQIAQVLEERFTGTVETQPELVARYYTEAGLIEQALPYWQRAGERATQRSAYVEAVAHLTRGLELLKALPDTPERVQQELALQLALGGALSVAKGYAAPEVGTAYARARELCRQMGETPQLLPALAGLFSFYLLRAELQTAHELAEQLLRLAQRLQAPVLLVGAHQAVGVALTWLGELAPAREHLEQGIALYTPQKPYSRALLDPGVVGLSYAAFALWSLGYPDQALKRSQEALTLAQELSHPFSLAFALHCVAMLHQCRREEHLTQERTEALLALSTEQGFPVYVAAGTIWLGWTLIMQARQEEGIARMRQGLAAYQATGAELQWPLALVLLAETYGKRGQTEEGLSVLAEALAQVDKTGERFYEAELYRLYGELSLRAGEGASGRRGEEARVAQSPSRLVAQSSPEECFLTAIEIARNQQAKSLELRAVMSLSRLWQTQGKKDEARRLLAEVYGWFTEGFDTKDLQEAKALLTALERRGA